MGHFHPHPRPTKAARPGEAAVSQSGQPRNEATRATVVVTNMIETIGSVFRQFRIQRRFDPERVSILAGAVDGRMRSAEPLKSGGSLGHLGSVFDNSECPRKALPAVRLSVTTTAFDNIATNLLCRKSERDTKGEHGSWQNGH